MSACRYQVIRCVKWKVKGVGNDMETQPRTRNRGFASMDAHRQREIARKGGRAAHEKGKAHEFTSDEARAAGRKGGEKVSVNRKHMAEIGRRGGRSSAARRRPEADSVAGEAESSRAYEDESMPQRSSEAMRDEAMAPSEAEERTPASENI